MKKILLGAVIIAAAVLLIGSKANTEPETWDSYVVKNGDTVCGIAKRITPESEDYRDNMYYIIEKNEIENGMIYPGQVILVPVVEE